MKSWTSPTDVEAVIRKAFRCTAPTASMSSSEAEKLNYDISRYDDAAVFRLLPLLLIKEMYVLKDGGGTWSGDGLIYFLDGYLIERRPKTEDPAVRRAYKRMRDFQSNRFKNFTHEQSLAVLLWLEKVSYPAYQDRSGVGDVNSAIKFWRERLTTRESR
jgi:hypothetical protein